MMNLVIICVSIPYRFNESRFVYIIYTSTYDLFYGQKRPFISSTRNDVKTAGGRQDIGKLFVHNSIISEKTYQANLLPVKTAARPRG